MWVFRKRALRSALFSAAAMQMISHAAPATAADWTKAQRIDVIATDYHFEPNKLEFAQGQPYQLHFENRGKDMHEFNAADMFRAAEIKNPEALNPDRTEIQVQPGQEKDLYFVPLQAGNYKLICPDHDWAGMTGEITVR